MMSSQQAFRRDGLFDMSGRVALVTGGGSGIGLMITQALAANGAKVYITGRTVEKLETVASKYGKDVSGSIIPVACDVTSKEDIGKLYDHIASREQCLCILVNNAGIAGPKLDIGDKVSSAEALKEKLFTTDKASFEDWVDIYRTNAAAPYFVTAAFLPLLQKSTERHKGWSGTAITVSSVSGVVKTSQRHFEYNASKAAATHVTRMLANDIATAGLKIRVNSISPGLFPSEMTAGESGADQKSSLSTERASHSPAGRPGKDEDMASTALFCAANQFLNGQDLVVDGGLSLAYGI